MYVTYVLANNNSKTIKEYFLIKEETEYKSITVGQTSHNYDSTTKENDINYWKVTFIVFRYNCFSIKPISSDVPNKMQCKNIDLLYLDKVYLQRLQIHMPKLFEDLLEQMKMSVQQKSKDHLYFTVLTIKLKLF